MEYFKYVIRKMFSEEYLTSDGNITKNIFDAQKFDSYKECNDYISDEIEESQQLDFEIVRYRISIIEEEVM